MVPFSDFDSRGYRMVDMRSGYGEWVDTCEKTVEDAMDIAFLDQLVAPRPPRRGPGRWHRAHRRLAPPA
jgi:hypothetical protein